MSTKVGINGFGRIGRSILRATVDSSDIEIAYINDLTNPEMIAHLLQYDSVHGRLNHKIEACEQAIIVNDRKINVSAFKDPAQIPWGDAGVDIVMECTGMFRDREEACKHLEGGAKKILISAPASNPDITIVMGVNHDMYNPSAHTVISNASCTTNCLAPVAKVLLEHFGIISGMMTTIHAYTGDQRLLDFPHKDFRRARAAGLSMIPTTTGAAKAVSLVLPELKGKLNGMSIRVPTPNVSMVDLVVLTQQNNLTIQEINQVLEKAANENLKGILGFSKIPLVSIDYNSTTLSAIVDASCTDVINGNLVKTYAWYDNETGYSARMIDLAKMIAKSL